MASSEVARKVSLKSADDRVFQVDLDVIKMSVTIRTMLDDLGQENMEEVIPLPNVRSEILTKVVDWATHHKDDPPILEEDDQREKRTDDITPWDQDFLKVGVQISFDL